LEEEKNMNTVNVSHNDLFDMFEQTQWREGSVEDLEGRLNNIRDTLRFILHDAGVRIDPDIAANDGTPLAEEGETVAAPETCEDRDYTCCEVLEPKAHTARYGY
jgi:hypothetical protein